MKLPSSADADDNDDAMLIHAKLATNKCKCKI